MHGLETLQIRPGATALVFGAGPTGLLLAQLIRSGGAASVTVAAPTPFKLDTARALGIDQTILIDRADMEGNRARLLDASGADGYDYVVEATGSTAIGNICVPLTRNGGTVLVYGVTRADETVSFHPFDVFRREITIKGSFAEMTSFGAAIRGVAVRPGPDRRHHHAPVLPGRLRQGARRRRRGPHCPQGCHRPRCQRRIARPSEVNTHEGADRTAARRTGDTSGHLRVPRHARPFLTGSGPRGPRARSLDAQQNTRKGLRPHTRWYIT